MGFPYEFLLIVARIHSVYRLGQRMGHEWGERAVRDVATKSFPSEDIQVRC